MPDRTGIVRIRILGPPDAVDRVADFVQSGLDVRESSLDLPNRKDSGVRRYLTVLVRGHGEGH